MVKHLTSLLLHALKAVGPVSGDIREITLYFLFYCMYMLATNQPRIDTHHASTQQHSRKAPQHVAFPCPLSSRGYLRHNSLCFSVPAHLGCSWCPSRHPLPWPCAYFSACHIHMEVRSQTHLTRFSLSSSPRLNSIRTTRFGYHFEIVEMQDFCRCSGARFLCFYSCPLSLDYSGTLIETGCPPSVSCPDFSCC